LFSWIIFIEPGQVAGIRQGFKASLFGFRRGKSRQDSFNPSARAMGAGCRCLIGQAQYKNCAALLTVEAAILVQRHRSHSYGRQGLYSLFGKEAIRHQACINSSGQRQGKDGPGAGF
jgi:hypothetical protein